MKATKLRWKLFIAIIIISIIPVVIFSAVSYTHYGSLVQKQVSSIAGILVSEAADNISRIETDMERVTLTFQSDSTVFGSNGQSVPDSLRDLSSRDYTSFELFQARRNMKFLCDSLLSGYGYINGIYIFLPNGDSIRYTTGLDVRMGYDARGSDWYLGSVRAGGAMYFDDVAIRDYMIQPVPKEPSIAFARAIYAPSSRDLLGVVMVDCGLNIFSDLDTEIIPGYTNISLVNDSGEIIYNADRAMIGQSILGHRLEQLMASPQSVTLIDDDTILAIRRLSAGNGWNIIAEIDMDSVMQEYVPTQQLIVILPVIFICVFVLVSLLLSGFLAKPVTDLANVMGKNEKAEAVGIDNKHLNRNDEIGLLYNRYNQMILEINDHIKTSYQDKLITMDAQMRSLEAQINAHFLFNTLESINCIAEVEGVDSIAMISKALGDMFRYSIKTKSELVTVEAELKHVENYLVIQQIRFEGQFSVDIAIEDGMKDLAILKLILQPVVENAVIYGVTNMREKGLIRIKGFVEGGKIVFEISDNGIGMTEGQMEILQSKLSAEPEFEELGKRTYESIGLKNINTRIRLYYSDEYGISVASSIGKGTFVTITVPAREMGM